MPDMTDLLNDLRYLLRPATFRIIGQTDLNNLEHQTAKAVELDDATATRHTEWDPTGVITNAAMATDGSRFEVGTGDAGIWLVGGSAHITQGITEGQRRYSIVKNGTERLVSSTDNPDWVPGATHWAHTTIHDFAAGDDFGMELYDALDQPTLSPISKCRSSNYASPPTAWGTWIADTTASADSYSGIGWSPSDHANVIDWWNDTVTAINRRRARPAAGIRVGSSSEAPVGFWGQVGYDTTEFSNTTGMVSGSTLVAPEKGFYYVTFGAQIDAFDYDRGQVYLRVILNYGGAGESVLDLVANAANDYRGNDVVVYGEGIIRLDENETVSVLARTFTGTPSGVGSQTNINASGDSHLRMCLLSAQTAIPNRETFTAGLPDVDAIDFAEQATDYLPEGLATAISRDILGHLVEPPVIVVEMSDDATLSAGGYGAGHQWRRLPLNYIEFDTWGTNQIENPSSGITVPLSGLWLVTLRATMLDTVDRYDPQTAEEDDIQYAGNLGKRGIRIELNDEVVAELVADPMLHPTHNWSRTVATLVIAQAGDVLSGSAMHTAPETLSLPGRGRADILGDVRLSAAWIGDRTDRARI